MMTTMVSCADCGELVPADETVNLDGRTLCTLCIEGEYGDDAPRVERIHSRGKLANGAQKPGSTRKVNPIHGATDHRTIAI